MATNYVQPGHTLELTAPSPGVVSGTPVKIGRIFAIPAATAATGEMFNGHVSGVFDIPKVAAEPWSEGLLIWWNTGSAKATSVSTTAMLIGVATRVEANPTSTGRVLLNYGSFLNQ